MGQGESVLAILRSALLCLRRSKTPRRRNLHVKDVQGSRNREESSRTSLDSTAIDALSIVFILFYFFKLLKETLEF